MDEFEYDMYCADCAEQYAEWADSELIWGKGKGNWKYADFNAPPLVEDDEEFDIPF